MSLGFLRVLAPKDSYKARGLSKFIFQAQFGANAKHLLISLVLESDTCRHSTFNLASIIAQCHSLRDPAFAAPA